MKRKAQMGQIIQMALYALMTRNAQKVKMARTTNKLPDFFLHFLHFVFLLSRETTYIFKTVYTFFAQNVRVQMVNPVFVMWHSFANKKGVAQMKLAQHKIVTTNFGQEELNGG
jgi:hypothetical protein